MNAPIDRRGRPLQPAPRLVDGADELPSAEWPAFVERECPADPDLRAEVLRLLEQFRRARAEGFLEHAAAATVPTEATEDYGPGEPVRAQPRVHRQVPGRPPLRRVRAARRPPTSPSTPTWSATSS